MAICYLFSTGVSTVPQLDNLEEVWLTEWHRPGWETQCGKLGTSVNMSRGFLNGLSAHIPAWFLEPSLSAANIVSSQVEVYLCLNYSKLVEAAVEGEVDVQLRGCRSIASPHPRRYYCYSVPSSTLLLAHLTREQANLEGVDDHGTIFVGI